RPGTPKTGGRIKGKVAGQRYSDTEAHAVLGSMMPDVVKFHYELMQGKTKATFSGPTGKTIVRLPNLPERQKSADWLADNFWKLDKRLKELGAIAKPEPVDEIDPDAARETLEQFVRDHIPPAPITYGVPSAASSEIVSITDPEAIKAHDRTIAAGEI